MMTATLIHAVTLLGSLALVTFAMLRGWSGWLALERAKLAMPAPSASPAARIELADLKERIRKLEAIAAGVDL